MVFTYLHFDSCKHLHQDKYFLKNEIGFIALYKNSYQYFVIVWMFSIGERKLEERDNQIIKSEYSTTQDAGSWRMTNR